MSQLPTPTSPATNVNIRSSVCEETSSEPGPVCQSQTGDISGQASETGNFPLYNAGRAKPVGYSRKLVEVGQGKKMIEEVAPYAIAMINAAAQDGVTLYVTSGFRTMTEQQRLWDAYRAGTGNLAARPGKSKHQTGIAIDIRYWMTQPNAPDYNTAYDWLIRNAYLFGFIRTVHIERWHWEYWGNWAGMQKPSWAEGWHTPQSMFSRIPRIHQCGRDSNTPMRKTNWWGIRHSPPQGTSHIDNATLGATNSWVGWDGQHGPDYWDRTEPGWDRRIAFSPGTGGNTTAASAG